jgi:hypothetical protein
VYDSPVASCPTARVTMKAFSLFISYLANPVTGEWRKLPPMLISSLSEEEAARTAIAVAEFACSEVSKELVIRVVGADGRQVAEIRRPLSN